MSKHDEKIKPDTDTEEAFSNRIDKSGVSSPVASICKNRSLPSGSAQTAFLSGPVFLK